LPVAALVAVAGALVAASVSASGSPAPVADDSAQPRTIAIGGASVLNTTRTIQHWHGQTLDPHNGVTYGYNMVGVDPAGNGRAIIPVDIIPLNFNVGGQSFLGTDVVDPILASPQFQTADYSTTSAASSAPTATVPGGAKGAGGNLSAGNSGVQLEDATMRAQFNKVDTSYHLILGTPVVHPAITITVPGNHGVISTRNPARGVYYADVDVTWFAAELQNLNNSLGYIDPTHLPLYVTNEVMLFTEPNPVNGCCIIGFHGAGIVPGRSTGPVHGNGNQPVLTYAWTSYITPGTFNPSTGWAVQDIHALSHEISEWADDPFVNNTVEPWLTPTAPQYGCTGVLETGDPVVGIGFSKGTNTFEQGLTPGPQQKLQVADGTYHPEDEALLPWFMRSSPNTISQLTQSPSANLGRYTFMGDLNPFLGFRAPATGC
jgi:hypothetical protein